jgi:hypothetical protein
MEGMTFPQLTNPNQHLLSDGVKWKVQDILHRLENAPAKRTLQDDLSLLRNLGLIESGG